MYRVPWIVVSVVMLSLTPLPASPQRPSWHLDRAPSAPGCATVDVETVLIDVSRSMGVTGSFSDVQAEVVDRIRNPLTPCTFEIVAAFGVTARVEGAGVVSDPKMRASLVRAVQALRATDAYTNLDEAANLAQLVSNEMEAAHLVAPMMVRVYSDLAGEKTGGGAGFPFADYFTARMVARGLRVSPGRPGPPFEFKLQLASNGADNAKLKHIGSEWRSAFTARPLLRAVWISLVLLVVVGIGLFRFRRRVPVRPAPLEALAVAERIQNDDQQPPTVITGERQIRVAIGVPVVFSTDVNRATYVAADFPGGAQGELFRVEPLPDTRVMITSLQHRLTVNGEPLGPNHRSTVRLDEPVSVRLGRRYFEIGGVFFRRRGAGDGGEVLGAVPLRS